jgi:hypothetical protein
MIELILGLFPGSVFVYRYAPRFEIAKIVGFLLMEIAPFIMIATLEGVSFRAVLIGFLVTYSVYEIGYLQNDFKAKRETQGKTERDQFAGFHFSLFMIVRLPVILLCGLWAVRTVPYATRGMLTVVIMLGIFFLHNYLVNPVNRASTFIALNSIKIIARIIFLSPTLLYYAFASVPHLVVKLLHYLETKQIVTFQKYTSRSISVPVYLGFMVGMAFIDWRLCLVCVPYSLNHCKRDIINGLRNILTQKMDDLTKDDH